MNTLGLAGNWFKIGIDFEYKNPHISLRKSVLRRGNIESKVLDLATVNKFLTSA